MTYKVVKGKNQQLLLLVLCKSSEMFKFSCKVSKKARISKDNLSNSHFSDKPCTLCQQCLWRWVCLKLSAAKAIMNSCQLFIGIKFIEEPQTSSSGALNFSHCAPVICTFNSCVFSVSWIGGEFPGWNIHTQW